jgi:hypothetical protein
VSDYPIAEAFRRFFGVAQLPPVSDLAIAIDTTNGNGNGVARSFVRRIEFLK